MRCRCSPSRCASFWTGRRTNRSRWTGYTALGDEKAGLTPLENAVRQAADAVLAEAKPADDELAALREAFVPAMVRVNDQGEYVRRPARWDELPAKSHPLLERLAKARLLVVRQDGDARVVEVAHEALLRKWPLLTLLAGRGARIPDRQAAAGAGSARLGAGGGGGQGRRLADVG